MVYTQRRLARLLNLGNTYLDNGQYEEAAISFEQAIAIDPRCVEAYAGGMEAARNTDDIIFQPSFILFFFPYRCTVTASPSKSLGIYMGVCAVHTFPVQFDYSFDAFPHPASGAVDFSVEAAFSCLGFPAW